MTDSQKLDALINHQQATDQKLDAIIARLDNLEKGQENLASQIGELSVEVGAINARLTNVEKVVNVIASKVGVPSVPAIGGGRSSGLSRAAKRRNNT